MEPLSATYDGRGGIIVKRSDGKSLHFTRKLRVKYHIQNDADAIIFALTVAAEESWSDYVPPVWNPSTATLSKTLEGITYSAKRVGADIAVKRSSDGKTCWFDEDLIESLEVTFGHALEECLDQAEALTDDEELWESKHA